LGHDLGGKYVSKKQRGVEDYGTEDVAKLSDQLQSGRLRHDKPSLRDRDSVIPRLNSRWAYLANCSSPMGLRPI